MTTSYTFNSSQTTSSRPHSKNFIIFQFHLIPPVGYFLKELINSLKNTENDYFYNNVELLETAYLNDLWLMEWLWAA